MPADYAEMADDEDMTYPDTRTHDQKVVAQLASLELALHKQNERINHLESWVQKLLNPEGDDGNL